MQIVDPNAKKPRKRQPKSNAQTPQQYMGKSFGTMGEGLFSERYYVRAKDPGNLYVKRMKETLKWNKERQNENARGVIYSAGGPYNATFGAKFMGESEILGIPAGSSDMDLANITKMAQRQKDDATMNTFSQRLQMLLGMLGDVTVHNEKEYIWRPGTVKILSVKGHRFQLKMLD